MHTGLRPMRYRRTLDAKPNESSIVKPGELVDIVEMTPLTLTDRRIYNLLIGNAWDQIAEAVQHSIPKRDLQSTLHKGTERLDDSIRRLMSAIVEVRIVSGKKWETKRVQLLGGNVVPDADDGFVRYDFHPLMRQIITESTVFARLHKQIMFALSSKYSLALYEIVQKRGNMNKNTEVFTIPEFRGFLGVPPGKLSSWVNFKNRALKPATQEVTYLSDYIVSVEPIQGKTRQFTHVRLTWERKELPELRETERELNNTKFGRKARLTGRVEQVNFGAHTGNLPPLRPDTMEKARAFMLGYDIYAVEQEWRRWAAGKPAPDSPDGAFVAFCKTYKKNNPLQ